MNGKSRPRIHSTDLPPVLEGVGKWKPGDNLSAPDLENISREELIRLAIQLHSERGDIASPAARLMFILAVALSPWRYRIELYQRPQPPIYADYTDLLLFVPDMLLLLTLLFWSISLLIRRRRVVFGPAVLGLPLAGLTLIGLLSVFESVDPALSLYHWGRFLMLNGFYLYIVNEIHSLHELVFPAILLVLIQSLVGIGQFLSQSSINLQALGEYLLDPSWSGVSVAWANGERLLRAYGLSDHPNILGGCLAFALLILSVYYACCSKAGNRPVIAAGIGLGSLTLLFTLSRSAWLVFGLAELALAWLLFKAGRRQAFKRWLLLLASLLILLGPFLLHISPFLGVRLGLNQSFTQVASEDQSIGERQLLNRAANQLFADRPLIGIGLGAFPVAMKDKYPDYQLNYQPAHLVLLDVAAETGLFGALVYALLLITPWLVMWVNRKRLLFTPMLLGASLLLLAVDLVGFFDYYTWLLVPGRLWAWLAWGWWGSAYINARTSGYQHA
jgi:O-antigen ligase